MATCCNTAVDADISVLTATTGGDVIDPGGVCGKIIGEVDGGGLNDGGTNNDGHGAACGGVVAVVGAVVSNGGRIDVGGLTVMVIDDVEGTTEGRVAGTA
jgi:hypothetical protein